MSTSTDQLHLGIDPVRNFKFKVTVDGIYTIGLMAVTGLNEGRAHLKMSRGITNSLEDRVFHDWLAESPKTIVITVGEPARVTLYLDNIKMNGINYSDLDAGANALFMQQADVSAQVTAVYADL